MFHFYIARDRCVTIAVTKRMDNSRGYCYKSPCKLVHESCLAVNSLNRLKMFQEAGKIFSAKLNYRKTSLSLEDFDVISVVNECAIKFIACVAGGMRKQA